MGIFNEAVMLARLAVAEKAGDKNKVARIMQEQQEQHEYRLRGERRVAHFCNRLFGWSIPDELK